MQRAIKSISVRLEGLEEKLKNFQKASNKIVLEEDSSQAGLDTSNRARGTEGHTSSQRNERTGKHHNHGEAENDGKTITFEKLSRVSSASRV